MTEDEKQFAQALGACRFPPATITKRFAASMKAQALAPKPIITDKQAAFLRRAVHTFRRQIAPKVVTLAKEQLRLMALAETARKNAGLSR